jgi:glutamate racemase
MPILMRPLGVFDSGVGGISVLREIARLLPDLDLAYVADTAYVPYGTRPPEIIRERSLAITTFLIDRLASRAVVVACNTATTHAVDALRRTFPHTPIVGMEPAIKPAAAASRSGIVGVLATGATLRGERFASLVERYTDDIELLTQPCPGLVEQVEAGDLDGDETVALLREYTEPMLARGADTIVLGCTHYPFLRDALQRLVGPEITVIDTGLAVARQVARVIADGPDTNATTPDSPPAAAMSRTVTFYTTGDPARARPAIERLWGRGEVDLRSLSV